MVQDKNGKISYYAMTIIRGVCRNGDIANDMLEAGLNDELPEKLSKEQILKIMSYERKAKIARLSDGYAVDDELNKNQLKIKGSFDSEMEPFSGKKHSVEISSQPSSSIKGAFEKIVPEIRQGNSRRPEITEVNDSRSKSSETLTKGGFLEIKGVNIKICGNSENVGLYFVNSEDSSKTVRLGADDIGINKSTLVACVVPPELESGSYSIKIVTQFMGSPTSFRKDCQTAAFGNFSVA